MMVCNIPPGREVGKILVLLSQRKSEIAVASFEFEYRVATSLFSIVPSVAIQTGGTKVTLLGDFFTVSGYCVFGGALSLNLIVVSDSAVLCVAPPHSEGNVSVQILDSNNQSIIST